MKANNLTIIPPEGMEAYQEGSEIKFRSIKKKITYDDIAKELFRKNNKIYFIDSFGVIDSYIIESDDDVLYLEENNCTSKKQAQKLLAINKLLNVAKYLNGGWKPDWSNSEEAKYYLYFYGKHYIDIDYSYQYNHCLVYFKSIELAQQAIDILGEETIKLALSTNW